MTIRYAGKGGSDANNGLTWQTRKLTLNGVEDTPVVAGDFVWVGAGTYRETLTVDVSSTVGNPITYAGDYLGQNTDGVGGVVRVTGSDNDQTATRASCINATAQMDYRTWRGFTFDTSTGVEVINTSGVGWIIDKCYFAPCATSSIQIAGAAQLTNTISNCYFETTGAGGQTCIAITHSSVVDNAGHIIQNCVFRGGVVGVSVTRVGGITVKNCSFIGRWTQGIGVSTAITVGQTIAVNNCIFQGCQTALVGTVTGEIVENFNTFFLNGTARTNTAIGANSLTYPALFDTRWFFQLTHAGAGPYNPTQFSTPFDLSAQSQIINVTGTNPSSTDMRGTAIQQSQREWGALEYDPTLSIKARQSSSIDGGGMVA